IASPNNARATTARRRSSASCPPSATNAPTSQDDSKTFVSCSTTVDIERPREGGAAISCSQIPSRHFSISAVLVAGTGPSLAAFAGWLTAGGILGGFGAGRFASLPAFAFFGAGALAGDTCTAAGAGLAETALSSSPVATGAAVWTASARMAGDGLAVV